MSKQKLEELHVQSQYRLIEKLRESEERYRGLYINAPIGLWEQDWSLVKLALTELQLMVDGDLKPYLVNTPQEIWRIAGLIKIIDVNQMALSQLGAKSSDEVATLLHTYLTANTTTLFADIFAALAQGKKQYQGEFPLLRLDGQQRYHYVSLIVLPGHEKTLKSVIVTTSDITANKESELALKKSEEFLRMSQLAGGIGTWEANLVTHQQVWSTAVMANLGFLECAFPSWDDFLANIHPDDRQSVIDATQAHLDQHQKYAVEYRIIDKHNAIRWMCSTGNAERDESGRPIVFRGVVQEITDRKLAEEKLRLSEKIFQATQEGILVTDAAGNIVDANAAFCRITGYSLDEVLGKNPSILQSGRHNKAFYAEMWDSLNQDGHWSGEIWNRRKDGGLFAELISISEIRDTQGSLTHYVSNLSDITLIKQHAKQLEHVAHYDALTGIPNRVLLVDRMQ